MTERFATTWLLLILAASGAAQEISEPQPTAIQGAVATARKAPRSPIREGGSVLLVSLDAPKAAPLLEGGALRPTGPDFADRWLLRRVAAIPGVQDVQIQERVTFSYGARTPSESDGSATRSATSERYLRVLLEEPAAGDAVRAFMRSWRDMVLRQILVEVRILTVPIAAAPDEGLRVLDSETLERSHERLRSVEGVEVVSAPSILIHERALGELQLADSTAYVADYEIEVASDGSYIANPVIETISEGLSLAVCAFREPESGVLRASFSIRRDQLVRPIPEVSTRIAGGGTEEVAIQLPEVLSRRWSSDELRFDEKGAAFEVVLDDLAMPGEARSKRLVVQVTIAPLVEAWETEMLGQVLGYDPGEARVFAVGDGPFEVGEAYQFLREGGYVGRGVVESTYASGSSTIAVLGLVDGEARRGDRLRR